MNAGFSGASKTWLPIHPNHTLINVQTESKDENSLLTEIRTLLRMRRELRALQSGSLEIMLKQPHGVLTFTRKLNDKEVIVVLNFSKKEKDITLTDGWCPIYQLYKGDKYENGTAHLSSLGAMILIK
jgi:glycosidase